MDLYILEELMVMSGMREVALDAFQSSISPEAKINLLAERRKDMYVYLVGSTAV